MWNPGKFCLWNPESWALEIWKTAQGIQNPSSTDNTGIQYLYVPVLGSLTWGKGVIKH